MKYPFDHDDGVTVLEESILATLEKTQELARTLAAYQNDLGRSLTMSLMRLVQPGTVLQRHGDEFGRVYVMHGADRRAQRFEVTTQPRIGRLNLDDPHLSTFIVDAYPLNEQGKRLSGRAGNPKSYAGRRDKDTVALEVTLVPERFEEDRLGNDILMDFVRRAALAKEPGHGN